MNKIPPTIKNYPAQNVESSDVEKSCSGGVKEEVVIGRDLYGDGKSYCST